MKNQLLYGKMEKETWLAFWEDNKLVEAHHYVEQGKTWVGAVIKGRVERYVPGMEAAFIDIGLDKNGFLPLIQEEGKIKPLQSGSEILVQVKKDPAGEKGAFLTQEIALTGRHLIYMPTRQWVGLSKRVTEEQDKKILQSLGKKLITTPPEGVVMRKTALEVPFCVLEEEKEELSKKWTEIQNRYTQVNGPAILHKAPGLLEELLREYGPERIETIITNDKDFTSEEFEIFYEGNIPPIVKKAEKELEKALKRKVWLDSGATLIIDPCEALTVIDVNTGKFTGRKGLENTIVKTNLEACDEIGRILRLRNIGGIVLIDFIDMEKEENQEKVKTHLEQVLAKDRIKTVIHGYTNLGIMEMTRKKTRNQDVLNQSKA